MALALMDRHEAADQVDLRPANKYHVEIDTDDGPEDRGPRFLLVHSVHFSRWFYPEIQSPCVCLWWKMSPTC